MAIEAQVVIVGAGPCGLFQVFELGLLGIKAHVVDSLRQVGGQCAELYPEKPIYDIPALPVCGAQELIDRLMQQIRPFGAEFHLQQEVTGLAPQEDGSFHVQTAAGTEFNAGCVVIAGGLGSFQPRRLRLPGIERHEGGALNYKVTDKERYRGQRLAILGGGDSALDWTLELYGRAESITLIHRRDEFRAQPASVARMQQLALETPERLRYRSGQITGYTEDAGRLTGLAVKDLSGAEHQVPADAVLVFWGLTPNLGPIAHWNLDIDKRHIRVDTEKFETSLPGVFAVGDINTYPGKKKLILSGFHEAALAAFGIHRHLFPDKKLHLQYTTTSPIMHQRLGVPD